MKKVKLQDIEIDDLVLELSSDSYYLYLSVDPKLRDYNTSLCPEEGFDDNKHMLVFSIHAGRVILWHPYEDDKYFVVNRDD